MCLFDDNLWKSLEEWEESLEMKVKDGTDPSNYNIIL